MNLRQVEAFTKLARTKNFSQAAEQMFISQPAFSRMIESLENEFGQKLFIRSKTNPRLTEVGERIVKWMDNMMQNYDSIMAVMRLAEEKEIGILRIGMLDNGLTRKVRDTINVFHMKYPDVKLELRQYSEAEIGKSLEMEWIDVAFVHHMPTVEMGSIESRIIEESNLNLAIHSSHILSERDFLEVKDLAGLPIIALSEFVSKNGSEDLTSLFMQNHIEPDIVMTAENATNALAAIDCNIGCSLMPDQMKEFAGSNVVFVPLRGGTTEYYRALWLRTTANKQVEKFIELFGEVE